MNKKSFVKLAISSVVIAAPVTGMSDVIANNGDSAKSERMLAKQAFSAAKKAESLLAKGKIADAVKHAEAAVGLEMNNLDYRELLARAYMKDGRFQSAERTLMDVMELGKTDARTIVSLALARIAQGKVDSAITLVDANQASLPAADYGLALALAGETKRGVTVLTDAIRADNATPRTRQNLALAYALDNQWRNAQVMAMQDMPSTTADERIVEWAQYARPGAYQTRIAGLLGVSAKTDSGQPVRLALKAVAGEVNVAAAAAAEPAPVSFAAVEPATELAAVGPAPVEVAAASPEPVYSPAPVSAPVFESAPAPVAVASMGLKPVIKYVSIPQYASYAPNKSEAPLSRAPQGPSKRGQAVANASAAPKPVKMALADTAPAASPGKASGSHLVQLGAYSSVEGARTAWSQLTKKYGVLQGFNSASSSVVVNGKKFVRLAAMGFGDAASANAVCAQVKSKGGDCVVKATNSSPAAPARMASASSRSKPARRIASR
jgi:D-alanyl-D-alanine carboxypeptidase